MMLYKFLPAHFALQAIESRRLKVSTMDVLNDIYDCKPTFVDSRESDPIKLQKKVRWIEGLLATDFGMISYCKNAESLLVWSHYGDSHKGIALGFELEDNVPIDSECYRGLMEVKYSETDARAVVDLAKHNPKGAVALTGILNDGYRQKGWDWHREEEYREFIWLNSCETSDGLYFIPFKRDSLKMVILGDRCPISENYLNRATFSFWKDFKTTVSVVRAKADPEAYRISLTKNINMMDDVPL